MDWSNERYVRIYVRDTRALKLVGWEGRAVFWAFERIADRAGLLEGVSTPEDLALMIDFPVEVVRTAWGRIIDTGLLAVTDMGLIDPEYIPAQEAKKSDRQRQRDSRAGRAARAMAVPGRDMTESRQRTEATEIVTTGHTERSAVTIGHSVQCSAVLDPPCSPPKGGVSELNQVDRVFGHWRGIHNHLRAKLDPKRRKRIQARLREGLTVDQLCDAISGAKHDDWLMGRGKNAQRVYDGIETLLRDRAQVERLVELHEKHQRKLKKPSPPEYVLDEVTQTWHRVSKSPEALSVRDDPWSLKGGARSAEPKSAPANGQSKRDVGALLPGIAKPVGNPLARPTSTHTGRRMTAEELDAELAKGGELLEGENARLSADEPGKPRG